MKIHIGREIEMRLKESGIKVSVFAKKINVSNRNIYNLFKRETLPTDQLRLIGEVLNFDFLNLYKTYAEGEPVTVINEPTNSMAKLTLLINLDGSTDSRCEPTNTGALEKLGTFTPSLAILLKHF